MDYAFTRRDELRQGDNTLSDTLQQKLETHLIGLSTDFGITNKYSIALAVPFIINRSKNEFLDVTKTGFGDLSVLIHTFYAPKMFSKSTNLQLALGATLPLGGGVSNVITDERNFASGTVDALASIVLALGLKPGWNFTGKFFTRLVFSQSSNIQKTGNYFENSIELNHSPILKGYSVYLGISMVNRGQDEINGLPFMNSGGNWVNLKLGGSISLVGEGESAARFWSEFQLPIYQNVNGIQLTENWNVRIGLRSGVSLFGHGETDDSLFQF